MPLESAAVAAAMPAVIPLVASLGMVIDEASPRRAVVRLPDDARWHNHVGGPHAGALFSVAETASGAIVVAAVGDYLDRMTPLAMGASIRYVALARGDVTAEATCDVDVDHLIAEIEAGRRPEFDVSVVIRDTEGTVTTEVDVRWTLKPNRR